MEGTSPPSLSYAERAVEYIAVKYRSKNLKNRRRDPGATKFQFRGTIRLADSWGVHSNFIDACAGCDVEGFVVGIAEGYVGYELGGADRAQVFSFWRENPDAAWARFINISFCVYLHAIGNSGGGI